MRELRIGIGAVSIALSLVAIAYPGLAVETAVLVISVILLIVGIEQIVRGMFLYKYQRAAHVGMGILVIALAVAAIAIPVIFCGSCHNNASGCSSVIQRHFQHFGRSRAQKRSYMVKGSQCWRRGTSCSDLWHSLDLAYPWCPPCGPDDSNSTFSVRNEAHCIGSIIRRKTDNDANRISD